MKKKNRFKKVLLSVLCLFVFAFSFALTNFNFGFLNAKASVIPDDSIVDSSDTSFYDNYYALEYIDSNGTAYINTNNIGSSNLRIETRFSNNSVSNLGYPCIFGSRTSTSTLQFVFFNSYANDITVKAYRIGSLSKSINSVSNNNIITDLEMSSSGLNFSFDGHNYPVSYSVPSFSNNNSIYIGCLNQGNKPQDFGDTRYYFFRMFYSDTLTRDFIPAQSKSDNKVGFYDLVSRTFFTSANSSNFTAGPRIYTTNFYVGDELYNTQSFTNSSDFILPVNPSVSSGSTFVGWSLTNNNDIESVVNPSDFLNNYSKPLNFYAVIVNSDYLSGYNYAKNLYDGFGIFSYANYSFVTGNLSDYTVIDSLTGRVNVLDFYGYAGGVQISDDLWRRVDSYEFDNEVRTFLVFDFDMLIPVSKYTNFVFANFQFGNGATFYFNDGTMYTFNYDDSDGTFVNLASYNTKFISKIALTYASTIADYGYRIGISTNPSYLDSYNNGYNDGKNVGYTDGYFTGYREGNSNGYNKGYEEGIETGSDYSFLGLISAAIDAPIKAFTGLFNFEIFGTNIKNLLLALFTASVIIVIVKLCLGGK